jgi:hypothetical protein
MDDKIQDRIRLDFEDHFNYERISSDQTSFARHYIENLMEIDLDSDYTIEFSSISTTVFGFMVAHIAYEYEEYNKWKWEAGFKILPPDEL